MFDKVNLQEMGQYAVVVGTIQPMDFKTEDGDRIRMIRVQTVGDVVNIDVPEAAQARMKEGERWAFVGESLVSRPANARASLRITRLLAAKFVSAPEDLELAPDFDFGDRRPAPEQELADSIIKNKTEPTAAKKAG